MAASGLHGGVVGLMTRSDDDSSSSSSSSSSGDKKRRKKDKKKEKKKLKKQAKKAATRVEIKFGLRSCVCSMAWSFWANLTHWDFHTGSEEGEKEKEKGEEAPEARVRRVVERGVGRRGLGAARRHRVAAATTTRC